MISQAFAIGNLGCCAISQFSVKNVFTVILAFSVYDITINLMTCH